MKRVVITGAGVISPLGNSVLSLMESIASGKSAVRYMEEWAGYCGMNSHVAAPAEMKDEKKIPRQNRRSMGRMSIFAAQAAEQALADSAINISQIQPDRMGCIIGSTTGSAISISKAFEIMLFQKDLSLLPSSMFFQCMSHSAAMNVAQYFGLTGYVMATSAACASSLQAIGTGYEIISSGRQDVLLCGGADELHPSVTGSFDVVFATSVKYNKTPQMTPRPFDKDRDGLVCGEGSGILVLEEYEHALSRNAKIYAEITGYNTCGSGSHISQSEDKSIVQCISSTLNNAQITYEDIDYINAHATGTIQGDKEEAAAIKQIFGKTSPVSSLKGHLGHTMAACGALEAIASIAMIDKGSLIPTLNLENVEPLCGNVRHIRQIEKADIKTVLKNNFALGGVNTCIVIRGYAHD